MAVFRRNRGGSSVLWSLQRRLELLSLDFKSDSNRSSLPLSFNYNNDNCFICMAFFNTMLKGVFPKVSELNKHNKQLNQSKSETEIVCLR